MDTTYRSRKFILATIFTITTVIALFIGKISGGEFIGAMATILGLYGASNIGDEYVSNAKK